MLFGKKLPRKSSKIVSLFMGGSVYFFCFTSAISEPAPWWTKDVFVFYAVSKRAATEAK